MKQLLEPIKLSEEDNEAGEPGGLRLRDGLQCFAYFRTPARPHYPLFHSVRIIVAGLICKISVSLLRSTAGPGTAVRRPDGRVIGLLVGRIAHGPHAGRN